MSWNRGSYNLLVTYTLQPIDICLSIIGKLSEIYTHTHPLAAMYHVLDDTDKDAWILVLASSGACICGSFIIFADVIWRWFVPSSRFKFEGNNLALTVSLGLSSGVMLFTALYRLLPRGLAQFLDSPELKGSPKAANISLLVTYISGASICAAFNWLLHVLTSQSVVHCIHDESDPEHGHGHSHGQGNEHSHHSHEHSDVHEHSHDEHENHSLETTPLLLNDHGTIKKVTILDKTVERLRGKPSIGKCMGYSYINSCDCKSDDPVDIHRPLEGPSVDIVNVAELSGDDDFDEDHESDTHEHHHHHVLSRYSHLLSIGIQTALAICVHKLPEGFLTFATTHADKQLGFSVFLALAIHNYIEGFTIAFPLYLALSNRWLAVGISIILGGCSQPIGAVLAQHLLRNSLAEEKTDFIFGCIICGTAGFMSIIGLQMFGSCIAFGSQQSAAITYAFIGMLLIGITACITG